MQGSVELLWPYFHNLQVVCRLKTQQEVLSWVTLENSCTDEHCYIKIEGKKVSQETSLQLLAPTIHLE